jgi:hypothetical protein
LRAVQNRITKAIDVGDHIHALQHGLAVILDQDRNDPLADETDHRLGIIFENHRLL